MTLQSSFETGDRVQIVLPELNLEAGAGDEYPQMGTGTVSVPTKKVMVPVTKVKDEKPGFEIVARQVIEPDLHKLAALHDERLMWIALDRPFVKRDGKRLGAVKALAVPEWLLKPLKPEEDPLAPRA